MIGRLERMDSFQLNSKAEDTALFADALLAPNGCRQGAGFFKTKNFKN
jgi:hypothetical protein